MSEDQLQPEDSLLDRGVDDALDEGYSPPDRPHGVTDKSVTALGELEGETLEERIAQEEPEVWAADDDLADLDENAIIDGPVGGEVGGPRAGRLVSEDGGVGEDVDAELWGTDVGIDGAGASAEEAAVHIIEDD